MNIAAGREGRTRSRWEGQHERKARIHREPEVEGDREMMIRMNIAAGREARARSRWEGQHER